MALRRGERRAWEQYTTLVVYRLDGTNEISKRNGGYIREERFEQAEASQDWRLAKMRFGCETKEGLSLELPRSEMFDLRCCSFILLDFGKRCLHCIDTLSELLELSVPISPVLV